ncbi:MAG: hypothetical protein KDD69_18210, partial [Bdellovibrionales bacterium]|nr:hypothetical protein [Bdellovibrionales bacterium]
MKRSGVVVLLLAVAWIAPLIATDTVSISSSAPKAELEQVAQGPEAVGFHRRGYPARAAAAKVNFVEERYGSPQVIRSRGIHRHDPSSAYHDNGSYFASPLLCMPGLEEPLPGLPGWVLEQHRTTDGSSRHYLTGVVVFSTPEYLDYCRKAVLEQDSAYALNNPLGEGGVVVRPWPITHLIAVCKNRITGETLAAAESGMLGGTEENTALTFVFDDLGLQRFQDASAAGLIQFVYYYTYVGDIVEAVSVELKAGAQVKLALSEVLDSSQLLEGAPIFQQQLNQAKEAARLAIEQVIRAENEDLIGYVDRTSLADRMFTAYSLGRMKISDMETQNPEAARALAAQLMPALREFERTEERPELQIDINEAEQTSVSSPGIGGTMLSALTLGLVGTKDETDRSLKRLENITGVIWREGKKTSEYVPREVKVYQLKEGWQEFNYHDK